MVVLWTLLIPTLVALVRSGYRGAKEDDPDFTLKKITDCRYRTFLSDMLLETCVRRELSVTLKKNSVARGNVSQLSQYTKLWAKCAETTLDTQCHTNKSDANRSRKLIRLHMLRLWSNMDKLIMSWEKSNGGILLEKECKVSLMTSSGRKCLPVIVSYTSGYGDLRTEEDFLECVKLETKSCNKSTQDFFLNVIQKNLKFRFTLAEHDNLLIKECIEVLNKTKMEICSPGLYDLLDSLAFERMIIEKKMKTPLKQKCIDEGLQLCSPQAIDVISDVSDAFLNVSLSDINKLLMRSLSKKSFILMPEDRLEISKCLALTNRKTLDYCLPGLYRALRYIIKGKPLKMSVLRIEMKGSGCLGMAFSECSGSMRYIIQKVYYGLYEKKLDIPFDKNCLVSPPGQYEHIFMDILYPPYNISGEVTNEISKCIRNAFDILEDCCRDMLAALSKVLSNKPLLFPQSSNSDCSESCYKSKLTVCSEMGKLYTERLIYSVKLAYLNFKKFGAPNIPPSPPYNLPGKTLQNMDECINMIDTDSLEDFCPGIFEVLNAIKKNETLPNKRIPQEICTFGNVLQLTSNCDVETALALQLFFNFLFRMYEESPSSIEKFYFRITENNQSVQLRSYTKSEISISKCLREHEEEMDACCPSLFSIIAMAVLNVPIMTNVNQLRWCSKFCYEPFAFNCESPLLMMKLINTVMHMEKEKEYRMGHLVFFPATPPYNLPLSVVEPISLCLKMMKKDLEECCPAMATDIDYILNDKPWNPQNTCVIHCDYKCYKETVQKCHPEGGDLTLGLMLSIQHCLQIDNAIEKCFKKNEVSFRKCCPDIVYAIDSIYIGRPFALNETKIGYCDIQCVVKSLKDCSRQNLDIIQKIMKYVIDYSFKDFSYLEQYGSYMTPKALQSINRCFDQMQPLLDECCPAIKGAVYTILNMEQWPVDGPNLKRCHHFCLETLPRNCSGQSGILVSSLFKLALSKSAPGLKEFGNACMSIIPEALGCCDTVVKSIFENIPLPIQRKFASRQCRAVCREKLIRDCLLFSNKSFLLQPLIKAHFASTHAKLSQDVMKTIAYGLEGSPLKGSYSGMPQMEFQGSPEKQRRNKELLAFGETVAIPPLMREKTRSCLYLVNKEEVDKCWPGFFDFLLYLYNGIQYTTVQYKQLKYVCECLEYAFRACPIDSKIVISSLTRKYLNITMQIVSDTNEGTPVVELDEEAKRAITSCVNETDALNLDSCLMGFRYILDDILKTGKSYRKLSLKDKECAKEIFGGCPMQSKLEIIKMIHQNKGVVLEIPINQETSSLNVLKLVSESERGLIQHCMDGVKQEAADQCLLGLYQVLSGTGAEHFNIQKLNGKEKQCLGDLFAHCSIHVKLIISDLLKLAGGTAVEIHSPSPKHYEPLTDEEKEFLVPCLESLDQNLIKTCTPELFLILNDISVDKVPDIPNFPVRIYNTKCIEKTFKKCSAESRMILTDLISKYTNGYSSLLFSVDASGKIDERMLYVLKECWSLIPDFFLDECLVGFNDIMLEILKGQLPSSSLNLYINKDAYKSCPKEIFAPCSVYHRLLVDELVRKIPHRFNDTLMFEILHPQRLDPGLHRHGVLDETIVMECFNLLNKESLDQCVPGLYDMIEALVKFNTTVTYFATKPIKTWCMKMNFVKCSYYAKTLIKDLLYDYYRLTVEMPLERSWEGISVNLGPPLDAFQECLSYIDAELLNGCSPDLAESLQKVYLEGKREAIPKYSADVGTGVLNCLIQTLDCEFELKVYIVKNIAKMNNFVFTYSIREPEDNGNKTFEISVASV